MRQQLQRRRRRGPGRVLRQERPRPARPRRARRGDGAAGRRGPAGRAGRRGRRARRAHARARRPGPRLQLGPRRRGPARPRRLRGRAPPAAHLPTADVRRRRRRGPHAFSRVGRGRHGLLLGLRRRRRAGPRRPPAPARAQGRRVLQDAARGGGQLRVAAQRRRDGRRRARDLGLGGLRPVRRVRRRRRPAARGGPAARRRRRGVRPGGVRLPPHALRDAARVRRRDLGLRVERLRPVRRVDVLRGGAAPRRREIFGIARREQRRGRRGAVRGRPPLRVLRAAPRRGHGDLRLGPRRRRPARERGSEGPAREPARRGDGRARQLRGAAAAAGPGVRLGAHGLRGRRAAVESAGDAPPRAAAADAAGARAPGAARGGVRARGL